MIRFVILVLAALLQACGGAGADPLSINSGINTDPTQTNGSGLSINRPATVNDGYGGGLSVTRNTAGLVGGQRGNVNSASYVHSIAGQGVTAFEWASLSVLDNYAADGENVAIYAQANKYGIGPTWALVTEVSDTTGGAGSIVGHELDVSVSGPDNGSRIGLDVVLSDSRLGHGLGKSDLSQGSVGVRIGSTPAVPSYLRWTRGIQLLGDYVIGIDLSPAKTTTAIRLAEGQAIALDANDQIKILYANGRLKLGPVLEIDTATGDIYKLGVKVL